MLNLASHPPFRSVFYRSLVTSVLLASTPAVAEWKIDTFKDRMADKVIKYASLPAKAEDHGISAVLELTCNGMDGGRQFQIRLSAPMTRGRIGANLRIDDRKVRPLASLQTFSDPYRIPFITAPPYDLWGRKRFRIELFPTGSQALFYDFDLSGLDKTIAALKCNKAPTETFDD